VTVLANRGVAGIDGTVSTAVGAALAWDGPAYALLGDLTFLHDVTALILGPAEPRPDLTLVVLNDDGGGLFHRLEQGAPEHAASFDRLFGTPTDVNLADWCAATGVPHSRAGTEEELRQALTARGGLRVLEVPVDRYAVRELHERIAHAVRDTLRDAGF
jgi:2-succinyl-5-enolpyruvyl-6-hydroxy-3-cyclohexene-1-carboxylate synthase